MFLFRSDGNPAIGAGHIMRCLSIAGAAECPCLFVTADRYFTDLIVSKGHQVQVLDSDYREMEAETEFLFSVLESRRPSVMFVDSYFVTSGYLASLQARCKEIGCRLVYIDDVFSFAYPCDILLDYNIYGSDRKREYEELYRKSGVRLPRLLLGTDYVPLREEFQDLPERRVGREAARVLISTGGSDPEHIARDLAACIVGQNDSLSELEFHFVVGALNEDRQELERLAAMVSNIFLHINVSNMSELMGQADVAISAAGSTLYELCATQTPTVTYILADNQIPGALAFERRGILRCAGDVRTLGGLLAERLIGEAVELAGRYEERVRIAERQRRVVDGCGAKKVVRDVSIAFSGDVSYND